MTANPDTATPGRIPTDVLAFLHDTTLDDVPVAAREFGRRCLLDLVGVAIAGRRTELSSIIHDHAASHFGAGSKRAPLFLDGRSVSPGGSALALGMTIDSIDAHDGNKLTKGHTGCHQLPALLATSVAEGAEDPSEFLAGLIVGYEIATRAGIALHETACDYHTSGAWGAVGAAGLASRVLGLDALTTFEAMGIAEYHGPRSQMMRVIDHPTMLKDGSGWGAMAGVSAAYLAADGFTGAPAVTINDPALDHLWDDLGSRWIIFEQYFKPHPICRWAQPAVEAALNLRRMHDLDATSIAQVHVETFHEAARLATALPETTEQAQYSLPFPVAAALVRGQLGASEVTSDALQDPIIQSLSQRVSIGEDASHNQAFPGNRFARLTIELHDGRRLVSEDTEPRGDPEDHLDDAEIRSKFATFAHPVVGAVRSNALETTIDGLGNGATVEEFLALFSKSV